MIHLSCLLVVSMLISVPLFYRALFGHIFADMQTHVQFAQKGIQTGVWPAHFLFQVVIYGLSGFSSDITVLSRAALVLLSACVIAKTWLSYGLLSGRSLGQVRVRVGPK